MVVILNLTNEEAIVYKLDHNSFEFEYTNKNDSGSFPSNSSKKKLQSSSEWAP